MSTKEVLFPYFLSIFGVVSDWVTTQIGLSRGFYETHLAYSPLYAFLIFMTSLIVSGFLLKGFRYKRHFQLAVACMSLYGLINNLLVLGGLIL